MAGLASWMRKRIQEFVRRRGYVVLPLAQGQVFSELIPDQSPYRIPGDMHRYYRPWEVPSFRQSLSSEALENTMLPTLKIYMLLSLLKQTRTLRGAVLEAGVWNGGSARLMADYLDSIGSDKPLWLLDTFEGYDAVNRQKDGVLPAKGQMQGRSIDNVKTLFANTKTHVHFVIGAIPGTLGTIDATEISFAHIDVNLYEPTRQATEFCLERMPRGGIIMFDDYNWPATYGAKQGIDDACRRFGQQVVSVPESTQAFLVRN